MNLKRALLISFITLSALLILTTGMSAAKQSGLVSSAQPQAVVGTGFTFQGYLTDGGEPADGVYDLYFELFDAVDGASVGTAALDDVVVSNGLFTVLLDFGAEAFDGNERWLEISVRPGAETGDYTSLADRQQITPAPYALYATNAGQLSGIPAADFWQLGGNTVASTGILGTLSDHSLDLVVNNTRILSLVPDATSPNIIAGYAGNYVDGDIYGATISGGGMASHVNRVTAAFGTVGGGYDNNAGTSSVWTPYATVAGGQQNNASGYAATIGGGESNTATNQAATTAGGYGNDATGQYATIPGGYQNAAAGDNSYAAGHRAQALHNGAFVWADSTEADFSSTANDQFAVRANGGIVLDTGGAGLTLDGSALQQRVTGTCAPGSMVIAIGEDGSVTCEPHDTLPVFNQIILDGDGDNNNSSIIIGADGLPIMSYMDATNSYLKVAHCNDIACTSATKSIIDTSETGGIGQTSITIGTDGLPIISYDGRTSFDLKVAHCNDIACTSATVTSLDTTDQAGGYSSIAIGVDGLPIISYDDITEGDLNVAHCDNIACTSATITAVDTADDVGDYSSITIGVDGLAIISYQDYTHTNLKVAHCSDLACTTAISNTLYSGNGGVVTSITIGNDGLPIIAFRTTDTGSTLTIAHCNEITCETATLTNLYENSSYVHGTITIGADGLPIIAFRDNFTKRLRVAHCNDVACTSASIIVQDNSAQAGGPSITIGVDGMPIISYTDNSIGDLKVTHCSNVFCVPHWRRR